MWFESCQERCGDQTCWIGSTRTNRKSRTTWCHAQEDDVESHQGHVPFRQRIDGYDSQRMLESRQRDDSTRRFCCGTMGTLTSSVFHAILPPWVTKMNVSMWVLCKHMLTDQQPSVYSHVTEQRHVKRSYDGTVANELDVLLCERPLPWLDPAKLETLSRIAKKHVQSNTDCKGASVPDRKDPIRTETASVKRNHERAG